MNKFILSFLFVLISIIVNAQVELFPGSLSEALLKAKNENKKVMIIGSTTWCGPCKHLTNEVLQEKGSAEYFGPRFVVKKYYLDKDGSDNIAEKFDVCVYPTIIFLNTDGVEINRILGSSPYLRDFVARIEDALLPENSFQAKDEHLKNDPSYAFEYASYLMNQCRLSKRAVDLLNQEFSKPLTLRLFTDEAWDLYNSLTLHYKDPFLITLLNNKKRIEEVYGTEKFQSWLRIKGDQYLMNVYCSNPTSKKRNRVLLEFLTNTQCMQGALYGFMKKNFDVMTSGDFVGKFKLIKKQACKTKDTHFRTELLNMLFKSTSKDIQKQYREDIISFYEKLAKVEKDNSYAKRYLNIVENLKNLDD